MHIGSPVVAFREYNVKEDPLFIAGWFLGALWRLRVLPDRDPFINSTNNSFNAIKVMDWIRRVEDKLGLSK